MKPGDFILTQTYRVGRVLKVEDPRVVYAPVDAPPDTPPEVAWLARVAVIPSETINALFGGPPTPTLGDEPTPVGRYQPSPTFDTVPAARPPWYTRVWDWLERAAGA
jgi:hypothetical protein